MSDSPYPFVFSTANKNALATADLKTVPEDFCVEEELSFEPEGTGEHVFVQIRKTAFTTENLIADISRAVKCHRRDIGYSGLKDKQAVTTQWISFPWPIKDELPELSGGNWDVLQITRHLRKLKRGVHQCNRFHLRLRNVRGDIAVLEQQLETVREQGVPNYFGLQRFGFDGANVTKAEALFNKSFKCKKFQRGLYYSAARSYLFNQYLHSRVEACNWNQAIEGDIFQLQGSHSLFGPEPLCDKIINRIKIMDIHPVAPLSGQEDSMLSSKALAIETQLGRSFSALKTGLKNSDLKTAHRALRLVPEQMQWQINNDVCELTFALPPGAFATAVLHELVQINGEAW